MIDVSNQNPLIRRAFMDLEEGNWAEADKHCEEMLNQEPENAYAYLGKLLAKLYCHNARELLERETPLTGDPLFEKILCFGTQDLRDKLNWIDQGIVARIEEKRRVQAQEEEEQQIQEEEAAAERKKKVICWLKRLASIVAVWIFVTQFLMPFFRYPSIERAKVGDIVKFGRYGGENLKWIVLYIDEKEGKKLLLSEKGIDNKKYHDADNRGDWENCTLRKWLNHECLEKMLDKDEIAMVYPVLRYNRENSEDLLFCLSEGEVNQYIEEKSKYMVCEHINPNFIKEQLKIKMKYYKLFGHTEERVKQIYEKELKSYRYAWWLRDDNVERRYIEEGDSNSFIGELINATNMVNYGTSSGTVFLAKAVNNEGKVDKYTVNMTDSMFTYLLVRPAVWVMYK